MKLVTILLSIVLLPTILLAEINAEYKLNLSNLSDDNNTYFDGTLTLTSEYRGTTPLTILKDGFYDFAINGKPVLNRSRIIGVELTKNTPTVISYKKKITGNDTITDNKTSLINIAPEIIDRKDVIYLFNINVPKTFTRELTDNKKENTVELSINHPLRDLFIKSKASKRVTASIYIFKVDKNNDKYISLLNGYFDHYKKMLKSIYPNDNLSTSTFYNDDYAIVLELYSQ